MSNPARTGQTSLAFGGLPGGSEWVIILIVALLVFGTRSPPVMRSIGRSLTEFKKGVKGIENDVKRPATSRRAMTRRLSRPRRAPSGFG